VSWNYKDLASQIGSVAGGLQKAGFADGQVFATDAAPTSTANVLLQLAASNNGVQFMTVANRDEFEKLRESVHVDGAVLSSSNSFLASTDLALKVSMSDVTGKAPESATDRSLPLAFYGSDENVSNRTVYLGGVGTAGLLRIMPGDKLCIATSTNHLFGMGSVVSGFVRNATVYLPDMDSLDLADSTLVFTDMKNIDKVRAAAKSASKLRGGLVMMEDFGGEIPAVLHDTQDVEGKALRVVVKEAENSKVMRALFDACADTYYDYK
jgi:hypothetical protein